MNLDHPERISALEESENDHASIRRMMYGDKGTNARQSFEHEINDEIARGVALQFRTQYLHGNWQWDLYPPERN